jgi:hypothetical protein
MMGAWSGSLSASATLLPMPLFEPIPETLLTLPAALCVGAIRIAVNPCAVRLERDDRVRCARQQLAVMADQQHGLFRRRDPRLQPALGRNVQKIVGLVEQQHHRWRRSGASRRHQPAARTTMRAEHRLASRGFRSAPNRSVRLAQPQVGRLRTDHACSTWRPQRNNRHPQYRRMD